MAIPTYTAAGAKAASPAKLDKRVFDVIPKSHALLKEAYLAYFANGRKNLAVTKTRGLVRGGGRKPWRQKGTGRARFGSIRVPQWRGGGIVFGPTGAENYSRQLNLKAKRLALRQAMSLAAAANKIIIIEDVKLKDAKTAQLSGLLAKIGADRRVVIVLEHKTEELARASQNLSSVSLVSAGYLNVRDVLDADSLVLTAGALEKVTARLTDAAEPARKPAKEAAHE